MEKGFKVVSHVTYYYFSASLPPSERRKMNNGFKAVFDEDGKLFSARENVAEVRYNIGEVAKPPEGCGPLCVFDNENDARKFGLGILDRIYECEYKRSKCKEIWNGRTQVHIEHLPIGTVLADEVILTKKV